MDVIVKPVIKCWIVDCEAMVSPLEIGCKIDAMFF